jgi:hypothetical protein
MTTNFPSLKTKKLNNSTAVLAALSLIICISIACFAWLISYFASFSDSNLLVSGMTLGIVGVGISTLGLFGTFFYQSQGYKMQRFFPLEFRIEKVSPPSDAALTAEPDVGELCLSYEALQNSLSTKSEPKVDLGGNDQLLFSICTEIWRLKKRMVSEINQGELGNSQVPKYVTRIERALESSNVDIHDHTGEKYLPGMALKVISFQFCEDMPAGEERILETVRPTVYRDGLVVRKGEVVVGTSIIKQETGENQT